MNTRLLRGRWTGLAITEFPSLNAEFLVRASLVAAFVLFAHQQRWEWLRTFTSEAVLQVSAMVGMTASRISFDTVSVNGDLFQYVTSCTFVDVFMGSVPLIWSQRRSFVGNLLRLTIAAAALLCFNLVRLVIAQVLYSWGAPWTLADDVPGGVAYLAVWLAILRVRSWDLSSQDSILPHAT